MDRPLDVDRLMDELRERAHRPTHGRPLFEQGPEELHVRPREIVADSPRPLIGPLVSKGKRAVTRTMQPVLDDLAAQINASLDQIVTLRAEIADLRAAIDAVPNCAPDVAALQTRIGALEDLGVAQRVARLEASRTGSAPSPRAVPPVDPEVAAVAADRARIEDFGVERLRA
jgi:hypothetical protein